MYRLQLASTLNSKDDKIKDRDFVDVSRTRLSHRNRAATWESPEAAEAEIPELAKKFALPAKEQLIVCS